MTTQLFHEFPGGLEDSRRGPLSMFYEANTIIVYLKNHVGW